jgi:molybdate transport system ATP-binding protein
MLVAGHVRLGTADAASRALARDGERLAAVFRPVDVRLELDPAGEAAIVRVEATPAGARVHTDWCAADVALADVGLFPPGARVRVRVAPEAVRFVPA